MKYFVQFPFQGLLRHATKLIAYLLIGIWANTSSGQVLISGTSFDPKVMADTSKAFWGLNDIKYTGLQGGNLTVIPPLATTVNANLFDATHQHAITNNPYKLDNTRYNRTVGVASDNQLVLSPYRAGTTTENMVTYTVAGLQPATNVEVRISYCSVMNPAYPTATCNGGDRTSIRGVINPDQNNTKNGIEGPQLTLGQCTTMTVTQTSSNSQVVGASGGMTFYLNNQQNGNCHAVAIKSIEVWGTPKPKVVIAEGTDVCAQEMITLSTATSYSGTYQWQVNTGSGWTSIGTSSTVGYTPPSDGAYQFRVSVTPSTGGGGPFTSDPVTVNAALCCTENGKPTSKKTIFYDDFGVLDLSDATGKTYTVWNYNNTSNPFQETKTTTTPYRWPLVPAPTGATFVGTPDLPLQDGEYAVASWITGYNSYNGRTGARLQWAGCVTGPATCPSDIAYDHSGKPEGAALFLNFPQNTGGQTFYTRNIAGLCQKELTFEAWIAVFTNAASGAYNPVNVKVRLTEVGNATNSVEATATATRAADFGGVWVKVTQKITLTTGTAITMELINNQSVSVNGNDLVLDDIKITACAPPTIDAYFDVPTLAQAISVCPTEDVPLYTIPSDLLKTYYANNQQYLFQWSKTPTVIASWQNIGTPGTSVSNLSITDLSALTTVVAGDKVYFRVIAALPSTFTSKNNFQGSAANYANFNDPCKIYSVSEAIEATIACTLPVHLLSFTAEKQGTSNLVYWTTVTESSNDRFEIERSTNGSDYEHIGTVHGSGNSNILKYYQFADRLPSEGTNYYRLKQIDDSGDFQYSKTIAVKNVVEDGNFSIYPNPNSGSFTIKVAELEIGTIVEIVDISGKSIGAVSGFSENGTLEIKGLTEGIYFVKLIQDTQVTTQKVVVY